MSANVVVNRRLYEDETRSRVVEEGDPDARYFLCPAGGEVPYETAAKYGLLAEPEQSDEDAEPERDEAKAKAAPANKARARSADK